MQTASERTPQRGRKASTPKPVNKWPQRIALYSVLLIVLVGGGGLYAAHLEDNDAFCISCHTEPEVTFFQREQSAPVAAVDLASAHPAQTVTCISCHSGSGVGGRVSAMTLGGQNALAFLFAGMTKKATVSTAHIADDNCLKCHAKVTETPGMNNHFHSLLAKWQALDPKAGTCVDCHQGHVTSGQKQLLFLTPDTAKLVCQRCHTATGGGEGGG